jgi:hypothetical protein
MNQFKFVSEGPNQPDDMAESTEHKTLVKRSKLVLGEDVEIGNAPPKQGLSRSCHILCAFF